MRSAEEYRLRAEMHNMQIAGTATLSVLRAENAKLRAALEQIRDFALSCATQHEYYIAMLKSVDIARAALNEETK